MTIGVLMLHQKTVKYSLALLFLHLPVIISPKIFMPELIFQNFPHILTLEGQYVFKNLIVAGAALKLTSEEVDIEKFIEDLKQ